MSRGTVPPALVEQADRLVSSKKTYDAKKRADYPNAENDCQRRNPAESTACLQLDTGSRHPLPEKTPRGQISKVSDPSCECPAILVALESPRQRLDELKTM